LATVEIEKAELDQLRADLTKAQADGVKRADDLKAAEAAKTQALSQVEVLKTEHQNAKDALAAAEAARENAELANLRTEVGWNKGVPWAAHHRLIGKTRAELEADADKYLAEFPKPGEENNPGIPPAGGVRFVEPRVSGDPMTDFLRGELAKKKTK